jgi:hypothetical protein
LKPILKNKKMETQKPTKEQRAIVFKKRALSILKRKANAEKEEQENKQPKPITKATPEQMKKAMAKILAAHREQKKKIEKE